MNLLHMMSLPVDLRALRRLAASRGYAADEGRALHHFLCEVFGKSIAQPFRLMVAPRQSGASLYAYTLIDEASLKQNAETAAPELETALGLSRLAVKTMPAQWTQGRRLAFDVRVRPVRRLIKPMQAWSRNVGRQQARGEATPPPFKKGAEVDAFIISRQRQFPDGLPEEADGFSRERVYIDWLEERLAGGALLDRNCTHLAHFARSKIERREIQEGPDATLHGELTITNSEAFAKLLAGGIGRHKAYGYGMLLLRPAQGK
ncbi:type I-E CRISPR-associated protein Cas6/Cse3/CasE [Pannonibacter phragmitetus]|uniref:type I-E CRISPR-associated protein Cas6/Cse3/CasE n=1 Tax=Pannonibacter phragmitetus TaxID=121719 RepID=UPI000F01B32E|nr:type I-E CRISPR-associated protein Cas6/Cse3/CasE [Pannonibacter phragmitetus]